MVVLQHNSLMPPSAKKQALIFYLLERSLEQVRTPSEQIKNAAIASGIRELCCGEGGIRTLGTTLHRTAV